MDFKKVTQLVEIFKDSKLKALNFDDKTTNVSLTKAGTQIMTEVINNVTAAPSIQEPIEVDTRKLKEITSEGVGFFYPSVEQRVVDANVRVVKGSELYYVKAMNLENHKRLDIDCKVIKFLVDPGKAVEYGQPLVLIEEL
jgi:biotin carboxyl carrier protein